MARLRNVRLDGSQQSLWKPASDWRPHTGPLPRLSGLVVALDTETRDDGLAQEMGPGWPYDLGYVAGVSVAWGSEKIYVPVRHPDTECRPIGEVVAWVEDILRDCVVCFFNESYDMGWLWHSGVRVWPERAHDGYIMSVMLCENHHSYSLDDCCARAGVPGKNTALLVEAADAYGVDPKSGMWQLPARYMAPYAEDDAVATLALCAALLPQIDDTGMRQAYQTEIDLVPVLRDMRARGIPANVDRAQQSSVRILEMRDEKLAAISHTVGHRVDMTTVNSSDKCGRMLQDEGIEVPRTAAGSLSVQKAWLEHLDHPLGMLVRQARQYNDLSTKFIDNYILGHVHRGRIHASVNQLRGTDDDGTERGAKTTRLAYSSPPLHQMPSRPTSPEQEELVRLLRDIFEPERGEWWCASDWSGQEPRILVHLAELCRIPGAEIIGDRYRSDPDTDYHTIVAQILGWPRKKAKDTNQGLAYGMGLPKLAKTLGVSIGEATEMLEIYNSRMGYIKKFSELASNKASTRGYIRLLDGARCHFDDWELASDRKAGVVHGEAEARRRWPGQRIRRAYTHKAANRAAQGGAARQMKRAMVMMHREKLRLLISMHDEAGASISSAGEATLMHDMMRDAFRLTVPVKVDVEVGRTWGSATHTVEEIFG